MKSLELDIIFKTVIFVWCPLTCYCHSWSLSCISNEKDSVAGILPFVVMLYLFNHCCMYFTFLLYFLILASFYNQFVWYLFINCSISNHIYLLLGWYSTVYKSYWKSAYCYFTKKGSNSGIVGGIQWYMVWVPSLKLVCVCVEGGGVAYEFYEFWTIIIPGSWSFLKF